VDCELDHLARELERLQEVSPAFEDRTGGVVRRRQRLVCLDRPRTDVNEDEIGECSADVEPEAVTGLATIAGAWRRRHWFSRFENRLSPFFHPSLAP
jgi:hypothetical protein